jgi:hypothetical protein
VYVARSFSRYFKAKLVGPPGPPGAMGRKGEDGASAYQIAVRNGYVGTEAEWLNSLKCDANCEVSIPDECNEHLATAYAGTEAWDFVNPVKGPSEPVMGVKGSQGFDHAVAITLLSLFLNKHINGETTHSSRMLSAIFSRQGWTYMCRDNMLNKDFYLKHKFLPANHSDGEEYAIFNLTVKAKGKDNKEFITYDICQETDGDVFISEIPTVVFRYDTELKLWTEVSIRLTP